MIEQLKSAGDQLRAAWENYFQVYSNIQGHNIPRNASHADNSLLSEVASQLDAELVFLSSYEAKIQKLEITIRRTRNYSLGVAPFASLPPEILTRIFHLTAAWCGNRPELCENDKPYSPAYPENLAQVCFSWRRTAISDSSLWCHIDLLLLEQRCAGLFDRAETYVARTGEKPVELHNAASSRSVAYDDRLSNFISGISCRVEALELMVTSGPDPCRQVFRNILLSQPQVLKKLVVSSDSDHRNTFIFSDSVPAPTSHSGCGHFTLYLTEDEVESGFAPLTILHLRGIFPVWSSAAYRGLVDLRLLPSEDCSNLEATKLITILESSPRLQILHFGLRFYGSESSELIEQAIPMELPDLQVLKIFSDKSAEMALCPSRVLRLLAPGSHSVSLCLGGHYKPNITLPSDLQGFFERSRVGRFYTRAAFPPMSILLSHAVHLERIVIDDLEWGSRDELPSTWLQSDESSSLPRLVSMHIIRSVLSGGDLLSLLDSCPNGIVMHSCEIYQETDDEAVQLSVEGLSDGLSTLRIAEDTPYPSGDPTADWDILG